MRRFLIVFALWTVVAILFAGQLAMDATYTGNRVTKRDVLVLAFTGWYAWALLYPLVAWLARRFRSGESASSDAQSFSRGTRRFHWPSCRA